MTNLLLYIDTDFSRTFDNDIHGLLLRKHALCLGLSLRKVKIADHFLDSYVDTS